MQSAELRDCAALIAHASWPVDAALMKRLTVYLEAEAKRLDERPYGCHCDLEPDQDPDGCVLDYRKPEDCVYARQLVAQRKDKTACEYWQPIEVRK